MKRALLNLLFFPVMTLLAIVGVTAIVFAWDELDNACRKRYVELDNFINS